MSNPNPPNQFEKGKSGNPNGRPPRDWTWASLYEEAVNEIDLDSKNGKSLVKKSITRKLAQLAKRGDIAAIKELANRMDGMPKQSTDITTDGESLKGLIKIE